MVVGDSAGGEKKKMAVLLLDITTQLIIPQMVFDVLDVCTLAH